MAIYQINKADSNATPKLIPGTMGTVIGVRTSCERVMSDVWEYVTYATAYINGEFTTIYVRGEGDVDKMVDVDATDDVIAAFVESRRAKKIASLENSKERAAEKAKADYLAPSKGKKVEVFKGRKVALGTVGEVKWIGLDNYRNVKVGLKVEGQDKLVYTSADNVRVIRDPHAMLSAIMEAEGEYDVYIEEARRATAEDYLREACFNQE